MKIVIKMKIFVKIKNPFAPEESFFLGFSFSMLVTFALTFAGIASTVLPRDARIPFSQIVCDALNST